MTEDDDNRGRRGKDSRERDSQDKDEKSPDKEGKENQAQILRFPINLSPTKTSPSRSLRGSRSVSASPRSPSRTTSPRAVRVRRVHTISVKASPSFQRPRLAEIRPRENEEEFSDCSDGDVVAIPDAPPTGQAFGATEGSPCLRRRATISKSSGPGSMEDYMKVCDDIALPEAPLSPKPPKTQASIEPIRTAEKRVDLQLPLVKGTSTDILGEQKAPLFHTSQWPEFPGHYHAAARLEAVAKKKPARFSASSDLIYFTDDEKRKPSRQGSPLKTATSPSGTRTLGTSRPQYNTQLEPTFENKLREIAHRSGLHAAAGNIPRTSAQFKPVELPRARHSFRYSIDELMRYRTAAIDRPAMMNEPVTAEPLLPAWKSKHAREPASHLDGGYHGQERDVHYSRPLHQPSQNLHARFPSGERSQDSTKSVRFDPAVIAWGAAHKQQHHPVNIYGGFYHRYENQVNNRRFGNSQSGSSDRTIIYTPQHHEDYYAHQQREIELLKDGILRSEKNMKALQTQAIASKQADLSRQVNSAIPPKKSVEKVQPQFTDKLSQSPKSKSPSSEMESKAQDFMRCVAEFRKAHPELLRKYPHLKDDILKAFENTHSEDDEPPVTPKVENKTQEERQTAIESGAKKELGLRVPLVVPVISKTEEAHQSAPGEKPKKPLNPKASEFRAFPSLRGPKSPKKMGDDHQRLPFLTLGRSSQLPPPGNTAGGREPVQDSIISPGKSIVDQVRESLSPSRGRNPQEPIWINPSDLPPHNVGAPAIPPGFEHLFSGLIPLVPIPHAPYPFMPMGAPFGPMTVCPFPTHNGFPNTLYPPVAGLGGDLSLLPYQTTNNHGIFNPQVPIPKPMTGNNNVPLQITSSQRNISEDSKLYEDPGDSDIDENRPGRLATGLNPAWRERMLEDFKQRYPLTGGLSPQTLGEEKTTAEEASADSKELKVSSELPSREKPRSRALRTTDPVVSLQTTCSTKFKFRLAQRSLRSWESTSFASSEDNDDESPAHECLPKHEQRSQRIELSGSTLVGSEIEASIHLPAPQLHLPSRTGEGFSQSSESSASDGRLPASQAAHVDTSKRPINRNFKPMGSRRSLNPIPLRRSLYPVELAKKAKATQIQEQLELLILHQKEKKALEKLNRNERKPKGPR